MGREIKFRAWNGKMLDLQKMTPLALSDPDMKGLFIPDMESVIIMQFTGLKDKNGKEIYEGDIVNWTTRPMYGMSEVCFYSGGFRIKDYPSEDNLLNKEYAKQSCEIVGNIYENPELI